MIADLQKMNHFVMDITELYALLNVNGKFT